jgi:hypothetical protein
LAKQRTEERTFTTELHRGLEAGGFHRVPIPDSVPARRGPKGRPLGGSAPRVYDLGALKDALYHGIELKYLRDRNTVRRSDFKPHQLPRLANCEAKGGFGWAGLMFHDTDKRKRFCYAVWYPNLIREFEHGERASASRSWVERFGVLMPQFKAPKLDSATFTAKVNEDGSMTMGRAWNFLPAHLLALEVVGRT